MLHTSTVLKYFVKTNTYYCTKILKYIYKKIIMYKINLIIL